MKRIVVSSKTRAQLMERYGISNTSLSKALNYRTNSLLAREIRTVAVNKYKGVSVDI